MGFLIWRAWFHDN